jgi:hypothetical protein
VRVRILKRAKARRGLFCFCMVYNEQWFLPHLLAHHRALGIEHFIFYDDRSTDGTRDMLMEQPDCTIIEPADEPEPGQRLAPTQRLLFNYVPETFGKGAWSLIVDADEFVILPTEFSSMDDLVRYLERRNHKCALAAMVDFYPPKLSGRFYDPLPPLLGSPWFDRDPGFRRVPGHMLPQMLPAGVRVRLLRMLAKDYPEIVEEIYASLKYRYAKLWKVPVLKTGSGIRRTDPHNVNVRPPDDVQIALAHIRFYPGLDDRVKAALDRQTHFLGSVEHRFLKAVLALFPDEPLTSPRSVEYRSPADLERAGLIWARQ